MKSIKSILPIIVAAVLATATIVERFHPDANLYSSWWFILLMAAVGLSSIAAIIIERLWEKPPQLLVHTAIVVILAGGALTTWVGQHGSITLMPDQPASTYADEDGHEYSLPFSITLQQFEVLFYPGTHSPMDFVSHVTADGQEAVISMNNILRMHGYRLYQEDYDMEQGSSTLSVAHDPWGIAVTYIGYAILILALIVLMTDRRATFRRLLRGGTLGLLLCLAIPSANATPRTLPRDVADQMGQMYILYRGRVCPVQTFAKDFTTKLTGKATYQGLTPEQVLSGWLFYYDEWVDEPMVKIKGDDVKELIGSNASRTTIRQLAPVVGGAPMMDASKNLRAASEKYNLVQMLNSGKLLRIFPIASVMGDGINWLCSTDALPESLPIDERTFISGHLDYCQDLVDAGDTAALISLFSKTRQYQAQRAADVLPSPTRTKAERLYNTLSAGRWLPMLSITLGLLGFAIALAFQSRRRATTWQRAVSIAEGVWVSLLTVFLLLLFVLRWIAGGHAPMAGGFDSMNLMALGIGIVALLLSRRHSIALPSGMLAMGFCLLVAMMSGSNPPVTNLMPVLNSPMLTLHVAVIMCSYALFFFVMAIGLAAAITNAETYRRLALLLLYPGVALLAIGIIIGAIWANISWGNYWSWDPKEVWALITLIVYSIPLQTSSNSLRTPRAFGIYCTLSFLSVVITYFGVNFLLGGMHSYS